MWITFREKSHAAAAVWIGRLTVLGNWTASLYILLAFLRSRGEWTRFWMGRRAG
jgi:hypothetical protein